MDQTRTDWLVRNGRPLPADARGTGIFLFPDGSGVDPRKQFRFPMTYSQCIDFAQVRGAQEFKWVPLHIADLQTLQLTPCGQPCSRFSGCNGGCICNERTGFCE
jgi:hypothetical protein